jgi:hypothetical protein
MAASTGFALLLRRRCISSSEHRAGSVFTLLLRGVERLSLDEIKEGNILFDLVFRDAEQLTTSDMEELYDVDANSPQAVDLLRKARDHGPRVLEINPSYGAIGLFLFQTSEMSETIADPSA